MSTGNHLVECPGVDILRLRGSVAAIVLCSGACSGACNAHAVVHAVVYEMFR